MDYQVGIQNLPLTSCDFGGIMSIPFIQKIGEIPEEPLIPPPSHPHKASSLTSSTRSTKWSSLRKYWVPPHCPHLFILRPNFLKFSKIKQKSSFFSQFQYLPKKCFKHFLQLSVRNRVYVVTCTHIEDL